MPTYERDVLIQQKDKDGNNNIIYPVTTAENVLGMEQVEAAIVAAKAAADAAQTSADGKAAGVHSHDIAEVTNLQTALNAKEALIKDATAKTTLVDEDTIPLTDSAATNTTKKITWANIKTVLKSYLDALYAAASHNHDAGNITGGTLSAEFGGTGRESHTANALIAGGTTTTAAQQSIALPTTEGKFLSGHAIGLPTWEPLVIEATCATAASTAAKVVDISGYTLKAGDIFAITYTLGNTANSASISINGSTAIPVYLGAGQPTGAASTGQHNVAANGTALYYYNGTRMLLFGGQLITDANTTTNTVDITNIFGTTASQFKVSNPTVGNTTTTYYALVGVKEDGTIEKVTATTNSTTSGTRSFTTLPLALFENILLAYATTTAWTAGAAYAGQLYSRYPLSTNIRYAMGQYYNLSGVLVDNTVTTDAVQQPLYLGCTKQDGYFIPSEFSLTCRDTSLVYKRIGYFYTAGEFYLSDYQPAFEYAAGKWQRMGTGSAGIPIVKAGGTANAMTATVPEIAESSDPKNGQMLVIIPSLASTSATVSLALNGGTARGIRLRSFGTNAVTTFPVTNYLQIGRPYLLVYDSAQTFWIEQSGSSVMTQAQILSALAGIQATSAAATVTSLNTTTYLQNRRAIISFTSTANDIDNGFPSGLSVGTVYRGVLKTESPNTETGTTSTTYGAYQTLSIPVLKQSFTRYVYVGATTDWGQWQTGLSGAMTPITFTVSRVGGTSGSADSTGLQFVFNTSVMSFSAAAVTVTDGTGKATLTGTVTAPTGGSGTTWTLGISPTAQGTINVKVNPFFLYSVTTPTQSVDIYAKTRVSYTLTQLGGASLATSSTGIQISFNTSVSGLAAGNITITNDVGQCTKGTLSGSGTTWTIGITNVTMQGNVKITIADFGNYVVTNTPPTNVTIYWNGQGSATYSTAGNFSWTCPQYVSSVRIKMIGGGGGGSSQSSYKEAGGGGGGGGYYKEFTMSVTAGQSYNIVVGAGGTGGVAGGANTAGNAGGSTSFHTTSTSGGSGSIGISGVGGLGGSGGNGGGGGGSWSNSTAGGSGGVGGSQGGNGGTGGSGYATGGGGGSGSGAGNSSYAAGGSGGSGGANGSGTSGGGGGGGGGGMAGFAAVDGANGSNGVDSISGTYGRGGNLGTGAGAGGGGGGGGASNAGNGGKGANGLVYIQWPA